MILFACTTNEDNLQIKQIKYGTSFGECLGYCKHDMILSSGLTTYNCSGWSDTVKIITHDQVLTVSAWNSITTNLDSRSFLKLPETIGCPDCADGGAEWIEIELMNGNKHKVTFEYMNEPTLLKNSLIKLREMLGKNKCN